MDKSPEQIEYNRLRKRLFKRFHEACQTYSLLQNGDHILVGLSGGKDSLLLTELLGSQSRIYVPKINVTALHVRVADRNYISDTSYLESFCQHVGVPLIIKDTEIVGKETKDPCFLCSWYRRKCLLDTAQELGCNKIAFGHHRDDVLETLLMNLIYEGRCSSIPPALQLDKMPLMLIRPLWMIDESDIERFAVLSSYQKQIRLCPFEDHSSRHKMTELLTRLQTLNPNVRSSLLHALECSSYGHSLQNPILPSEII